MANLLGKQLDDLDQEKERNDQQQKEIDSIEKKINRSTGKQPATAKPTDTKTVTRTVVNPQTGTPEKKTAQVPVTPSNVIPMPKPRTPAPVAMPAGSPAQVQIGRAHV